MFQIKCVPTDCHNYTVVVVRYRINERLIMTECEDDRESDVERGTAEMGLYPEEKCSSHPQ